MNHRALLPALAAVVALLVAGCGGDARTVAHDPAPSGGPTTSSPSPSPSPSPGSYPRYEPTDYGFDLVVSCFCAGANTPIRVTVLHARVVGAVYLGDATGRGDEHAGDPADNHYWISINDVIDAANNPRAHVVKVDWPSGQDYPSSVYVDPAKNLADDEVGYAISNVTP